MELYNKHKESYGWTWSIYTSCIRQFRKSVNKEKYNYLRVLLLFLKEELFFFFKRKQTLKAELKPLIEAIQYASATLKFRGNKKIRLYAN